MTASEFAACTLEDDPRSIAIARNVARATLRGWLLDDLVDDVAAVASELVANALRHGVCEPSWSQAPHPVVLSLLRRGPEVVCAVFDPGTGVPRVCVADPFAESGRGMRIVECLSDSWGWSEPGPYGKAVWARFSEGGRAAAPAEEHGVEQPLTRLLVLIEVLTGSSPPQLQAVA
ncbi:ATP-binding protein [Streptomyces aculeolatus]|uniref:ATP-binding protein n=1 Tax=Streptomyces aculeolatus TaxID=270689 RepID=UPI000560225D|nr:ATP-binding protein [Streptomyces aculeolatus]